MKKIFAIALIGLLSVSFTVQASTTFADDVAVVDNLEFETPVILTDCVDVIVEVSIDFVTPEVFDLYYTADVFGNFELFSPPDKLVSLISDLNIDLPEPEPYFNVSVTTDKYTVPITDLDFDLWYGTHIGKTILFS